MIAGEVGFDVGVFVGIFVGAFVGTFVGFFVGFFVGGEGSEASQGVLGKQVSPDGQSVGEPLGQGSMQLVEAS